ncbi:MAG TPA: hypothetical protein PKA74_03070 [Bauldia sp.]|nr:hypothetical protein [Bauldia sp.]
MGTLSMIRTYASRTAERLRAARRQRRRLRVLESLDQHVLKDIGWIRDGVSFERVG